MKRLVSFFEIPVADFNRSVKFYEGLFGIKMEIMDCGNEKMAFFPEEEGQCVGAISWSADFDFKPGANGVLVSLSVENMEKGIKFIESNGGKILIPKTKIESEGRGYFSVFIDSEENRVGLYSDN